MKCKDFWRKYEESGLTPKFEKHLEECNICKNEIKIEVLLNKKVKTLHEFKAPEELWEKISGAVQENHKKDIIKMSLIEKIINIAKNLFPGKNIVSFKPAVIGMTSILLIAIGIGYYYNRPLSTEEKIRLQIEAAAELEKTEKQYLASIEKFSELVESNKENIDSELYQLYQERLAILDDYIAQCKEAISQNEYNINARKYLFLAYNEKVETLKTMSKNLSFL